ncbi:unnamed protein product [Discula destructiva]
MATRPVGSLLLFFFLLLLHHHLMPTHTVQAASIRHKMNHRQVVDTDTDDDDDAVVPPPAPVPAPTPTPASTPTPATVIDPRPGLDDGAKAGIAIGVILGVMLIGGLIFMYLRRRWRRRQGQQRDHKLSPGDSSNMHKPEVTLLHNVGSSPTSHNAGHTAFNQRGGGGGEPNSCVSTLSNSEADQWSRGARTVSTPSTEAGSVSYDGFHNMAHRSIKLSPTLDHRAVEAPVFENTIWEVADTDRSGLSPVELPASGSWCAQSPSELATDKGSETTGTGGFARTAPA